MARRHCLWLMVSWLVGSFACAAQPPAHTVEPLPSSVYATPNGPSSEPAREEERPQPLDEVTRALYAAEQALRARRFDAAEAAANAGIEAAQRMPMRDGPATLTTLYRVLGFARAERGLYPWAAADFGQALVWSERANQGPVVRGYLNLLMGRSQLLSCDFDKARETLDRVVQIEGPFLPKTEIDLGLAWANLAEVDAESGRDDGARANFERAIPVLQRTAANDPAAFGRALHELALFQARRGQRREAIQTLEQVIELASRYPFGVNVTSDVTKYQELVGPAGDAFLASHGIVVWRRATSAAAATGALPTNPAPSARCPKPASNFVHNGQASNAEHVVAGMRPSFRGCYKNELLARTNAEGQIRMTGKIDADGSVIEVVAIGSGFSAAMVGCTGTQFMAAKFAPPDGGGASIVIPVTFMFEGHGATRLPF